MTDVTTIPPLRVPVDETVDWLDASDIVLTWVRAAGSTALVALHLSNVIVDDEHARFIDLAGGGAGPADDFTAPLASGRLIWDSVSGRG